MVALGGWLRGRPSPQPSPQGGICVTRRWLHGRPLTDFRRGRRNLPLPSERVKTGVPLNRLTANTVAFPRVRVRATADSRGRRVAQGSPEGGGEGAGPSSRTRRGFATVSQRRPGGCVIRAWVRGRPLTEFGRRRPILPLPLERVKTGGTSALEWIDTALLFGRAAGGRQQSAPVGSPTAGFCNIRSQDRPRGR